MIRASDWPKVQLGDYVNLLTGYPFKSAEYIDDPDAIPLIRGYNIMQGKLRWSDMKRWPVSKLDSLSKYYLKPGDVVLAMDRPWIEAGLKQARISERDCPCLLVQRVARLRGVNGLLTNFLRYVVAEYHFSEYLRAIVTGVNVPHISASQIKSYEFRLPPLPTQRKIAAILSAYDDLIENNTRRIAILEQMAQAIYREWFVHFRFPGHEGVRLVESDLGPVPEGWEVVKLKDVCRLVNYGYTAKAQTEKVGPKFLRITDIVPPLLDWNSVPYCEIDENKIEKYLLIEGDIVIARTGATVGYAKRVGKRHPQSVFASYLVRLRIEDQFSNFMIGLLVESDEYKNFVNAHRSGAAQPQANAQVLTSLNIVLPPKKIQDLFDDKVRGLFDYKEILLLKNTILRQTRDLLLPRLISGEVDISDLAIDLGEN